MFESLINAIYVLLGRSSYDSSVDINLGADFSLPGNKGFYLYVGVTGVVKGTTANNDTINRTFTVGYHPIKMKLVSSSANGTTATNLAACY